MNFYVYTYTDPRNNLPFYVGKGKLDRDVSHLKVARNNSSRKTHCSNYCRSLIDLGIEPIIERVAENLIEEDAIKFEETLILKWGRLGFEFNGLLVNKAINGRSNTGYKHSEETKKKLSLQRKGTPHSEETRKLIAEQTSKAILGNPEARRKISETHLGKKKSEEHAAKLAANLTKLNQDPEIIARKLQTRIDNGNLNHTEETREIISQRTANAMKNPEVVEKMKNSSKARWSNPEEREKISKKNAKTFHLCNRETGESFTITNLAKYCRENKTYEQKVYKEFIVEKLS